MITTMLAALALAATPSAAKPLNSYEPATIVRYLQEGGYKAKLTADTYGDPQIDSSSGGTGFGIFFYGCEHNQHCETIAFNAGYDYDEGKEPDLKTINEFNRKYRYIRASIDDENDPALDMDVLFTDGKLNAQAFQENLDLWVGAMGDFEKHIGW